MKDQLDLNGRRIVITGGTTGIGRAAMRVLAEGGARLLTIGRHQAELDEAVGYAREGGGEAEGVVGDVAKREDVERLFARADALWGGLDAVVCNAGIGGEGLGDSDDDAWRYTVATNFTGALACAKAALDRMIPRKDGQVLVVGSMSADNRSKGQSVYAATKAGLQAFCEALHKEQKENGIRVGVIEPGLVGTPMQEDKSIEEQREMIQKREMLHAFDIAEAIRWALVQPPRSNLLQLRIEPLLQ